MPVFVYTYDPANDAGRVRLLVNDVGAPWVFADSEIQAFLDLNGGAIKLAAAQAIDANATNEALASKVLRDNQVTTDGAKLADAMRKHAASLRQEHAAQLADDDDGYFEVVDFGSGFGPELTGWY